MFKIIFYMLLSGEAGAGSGGGEAQDAALRRPIGTSLIGGRLAAH